VLNASNCSYWYFDNPSGKWIEEIRALGKVIAFYLSKLLLDTPLHRGEPWRNLRATAKGAHLKGTSSFSSFESFIVKQR